MIFSLRCLEEEDSATPSPEEEGNPLVKEVLLHPPLLKRAKMPPVSLSYPSMKLKQEGNLCLNLQNLYPAATEALPKSR